MVGLLLPPLAHAQARPDTASYLLTNTQLANMGGAAVLNGQRLVLVNVTYPSRRLTLVDQHWLDPRLRLRRLTPLRLPGHLKLAAVQGTTHFMLIQLLSRDSLVLVTVDTTGHMVATVREPLAGPRSLFEFTDLNLPHTDGFVTMEQLPQKGTCRLTCRGPNLVRQWEKTFGPNATLMASASDSTHLWVVLMADYQSRHPVSTAVCLELASGRELARMSLTNEQARRVPSVVAVGADHSLLVAGHAFDGEPALLRRSGDLFFQRLSPSGQVLADHLTNFEHEPMLHGAAAERVQWQLLWPLAQGQVQLVGETYSSSSAGGEILAAALTMGIGGQTVLRPKDIVSVRLGAGGQVEQLRVVPLPLDKGSYSWPTYVHGREMARRATVAGTFRTRGMGADSTTLVLRSPQQIQTLDLGTGQRQLVQGAPAKGEADVMYVGADFMVVGEIRPAHHTLRIRRLPLLAGSKAKQ